MEDRECRFIFLLVLVVFCSILSWMVRKTDIDPLLFVSVYYVLMVLSFSAWMSLPEGGRSFFGHLSWFFGITLLFSLYKAIKRKCFTHEKEKNEEA